MSDLSGKSILIVERRIDDFIVELQQALEARGAETMVIRNLERAVELLDNCEFSVVVLGVLNETADKFLDHIAPRRVVFYTSETRVSAVVEAVVDLGNRQK